ncbi:MAG: T9SS type A sorting domain-containing protein [Leeuwenhoekiella sp.]
MKPYITLLLFTIAATLQAQVEKIETFTTGTKITFYPDSCGEDLPEADGKISFCDRAGNLGVVERSYGLNYRGITKAIPNYYNNDEVFLTRAGFSIRKENGTWLNIPQFAFPRRNLTTVVSPPVNAVVDSNGILYFHNGSNEGVQGINLSTLKFFSNPLGSDFIYARNFAFDTTSGITYILALNNSKSEVWLYTAQNGAFNFVKSLGSIPTNALSQSSALVQNGKLYVGGSMGLYELDLSNMTNKLYNTSNGLLKDYIIDMEAAPDGKVWLAARSSPSVGGIVSFEPGTSTFKEYVRPIDPYEAIIINDIGIEDNNTIWATSGRYNGLMRMTVNSDSATFEDFPLSFFDELNLPVTYRPDDIAMHNGKMYFSTIDGSSGLNRNFEGLIYDNGNWTGINDDVPGNVSSSLSRRFTNSYPGKNGTWWGNSYDDVLTYVSDDDEFSAKYNLRMSQSLTVDEDNRPVVISSSKVTKYSEPLTFQLPAEKNVTFANAQRYKDQIWGYNRSGGELVAYKFNNIVSRDSLDENYASYFRFNMDTEGHAWFARYDSQAGNFIAKEFNTGTNTTTTHTFATTSIGTLADIVTMPNGTMAFVGSNAVIVYNGDNFVRLDRNLNSVLSGLQNGVADENGNLHLLRNDLAQIITVSSIFDTPEISVINIEGNNSVVPYIDHYRPDWLTIDAKGNYWTHARGNFIKIHPETPIKAFYNEGETFGITGRVYNDINGNNTYDEGEAYANQHLAVKAGDLRFDTYSGVDGRFNFSYFGEGVTHTVTLLNSDPYILIDRVQASVDVTDTETNLDLGNFKIEPRYVNGLVVKSSAKLGLYAFDRAGFKNTFTAAIGSLANAKTYQDLSADFIFKNEEGSDNVIPNILGVKMYKVTPKSASPIIRDITIEPRNHRWNLTVPPDTYTLTETTTTPQITTTPDQTTIGIDIGDLKPFEAIILEIETDLFDPVQNGNTVSYGVAKVSGTNIKEEDGGGTTGGDVVLIPPAPEGGNVGGPQDLGPYIDPDDVYSDPPYTDPKDIYTDPPYNAPILSSYDPNDKLVTPGLPSELNEVDIDNKWLQYMVRFENEGNFSAKDVYVVDEIDEDFDINSFQILESSHPVKIEQITVDGKTTMKFAFNDIYLDFTDNDPEASQGYVKYLIKAKDDIVENTVVENTASIYFDQNPAIVTNTTQNQFVALNLATETSEVFASQIKFFPNPVNNGLNIKFSKIGDYDIQLYDLSGKLVMTAHSKNKMQERLSLTNITTGIYLLKVQGDTLSRTVKIIKQ